LSIAALNSIAVKADTLEMWQTERTLRCGVCTWFPPLAIVDCEQRNLQGVRRGLPVTILSKSLEVDVKIMPLTWSDAYRLSRQVARWCWFGDLWQLARARKRSALVFLMPFITYSEWWIQKSKHTSIERYSRQTLLRRARPSARAGVVKNRSENGGEEKLISELPNLKTRFFLLSLQARPTSVLRETPH